MDSKRWQIFAGTILIVVATSATALSLGRVRGTALVGRSLDLSVSAGLDATEAAPDASCSVAEVFYGDTRVAPNAVNIISERSSSGELRIRVRSSIVVDEPVVTLFLRVGCTAVVSRRYVLLAEAVSEAEPDTGFVPRVSPANTREVPAGPLSSPRLAFGGAIAGNSALSAAEQSARRADRVAQREARKQARSSQASSDIQHALPLKASRGDSVAASIMRKSAKPATPRLQIDLLDLSSASMNLRGSSELATAPTSDEATRSSAQALWRTLNASPEEALRDATRLATLDAQMRTVQDTSKRQGQELIVLSTELEAAKKARYFNPFTLVLAVLALAALALSAVLWMRHRNGATQNNTGSSPWWGVRAAKQAPQDEQHLWKHLSDGSDSLLQPLDKSEQSGSSSDAHLPDISPDNRFAASTTSSGSGVLPRFGEKSQDALGFKGKQGKSIRAASKIYPLGKSAGGGRASSVARADDMQPSALVSNGVGTGNSAFSNNDFAPSALNSGLGVLGSLGGARVVAAEELFDIQEQADFFLSLGQPEQAIEVLKNHITENVETSALAYMDLFDIYHRTQRKADYAELREEFNRVFNAQVPEFEAYGAQSNGLEDFPQVLNPIQASWVRPQEAQDVIEESIFRQPEQDQTLDMAAYRELMLLYALAKQLSRPDAAYSILPTSTQTPAGGTLIQDADTSSAKFDVGDGLIYASPTDDLLSTDDRTVSLSYPLVKSSDAKPDGDGGLDFDLSDSEPLTKTKSLNRKK